MSNSEKEDDDFFKLLVDNCNQAMIVQSMDAKVLYWNDKAEEIFHFSKEEAIGENVINLVVPPQERARYESGHIEEKESLADYYLNWLNSVKDKNITLYMVNKERSEILVRYYCVILKDRDIILSYVTPVHSESVTVQNIIDQSPYLIYAKDKEGRYTEINNNIERVVNKKREDIIGKTDFEVMDHDIALTYQQRELEIMNAKAPITHEDLYIDSEGHRYWLSTTRFPLRDADGNVLGTWGISHDVTKARETLEDKNRLEKDQLKQKEQIALQASQVKSEFLSNMSHEIRTPLNGIVGLNNLLKDTNLDEEQLDLVDGIERSCGVLMSIINDILDLAKADAGKIELELTDMDLGTLLDDISIFFTHQAKNKKISFSIQNDISHSRLLIKSDYARLRQILTNLISNAIKFTFKGGVSLRCQLIKENDWIRFEVKDTGIGIEEEKIKKLFSPFTQADSSTTRLFGGTGLGLSICKSFVTLMKGKLGVESEYGSGSTFWVEIPYVKASKFFTGSKKVKKEEEVNGCYSILVAEDNPMNQKVILKTLQKLGQKGTAADNGLEAVQLLQMNPERFDLVFMDCSMPIMDGYEATKEIRRMPEPIRSIPIIAMTANALPTERENVMKIGMNEYVSKSFERSDLIKMLNKFGPKTH